jgi:small subunit ribosomal protein S18
MPPRPKRLKKPKKREGLDRKPKRKVCSFCVDKVTKIDYKDMSRVRKFVSERGKIVPRRISGTCARHQRALTTAIKRARVMALISFAAE